MNITKKQLKRIIKEELGVVSEGGNLQNAAKGAAMELLDTAKIMSQAPSHEPASLYAKEVAKQANLIMDALVDMEDDEAGRYQRQSPSGDSLREDDMNLFEPDPGDPDYKEKKPQGQASDFRAVEELLEVLATQFNVMEDEAPSFLRKMADKLEGV
jgi:hypothetical protein